MTKNAKWFTDIHCGFDKASWNSSSQCANCAMQHICVPVTEVWKQTFYLFELDLKGKNDLFMNSIMGSIHLPKTCPSKTPNYIIVPFATESKMACAMHLHKFSFTMFYHHHSHIYLTTIDLPAKLISHLFTHSKTLHIDKEDKCLKLPVPVRCARSVSKNLSCFVVFRSYLDWKSLSLKPIWNTKPGKITNPGM